MRIERITTEELRKKRDEEGLILQGCGGNPEEWLEGINDLFTNEELLESGTKFESCWVFERDGLTCILFPFEGVKLNMVKLAMWRLRTHETFGGTWLSDYEPNRLGGFIEERSEAKEKADCPLIGEEGNIFNLMGLASQTLRRNGMKEESKEMCERIRGSGDYDKALSIIGEYVNITTAEETEEEDLEQRQEQ